MGEVGTRVRRRHVLVLAGAFLVACGTPATGERAPAETPASAPAEVVRIDGGVLQGTRSGAVAAFKGIPYAAPPVGALRWRAPQPVAAWSGVRDASRFGNDCMQNKPSWDTSLSRQPVSEDCLYLNVWTPAPVRQDAVLPVMVWVHGGGFVSNSGASPFVDGARLAARGVVVVNFNYRLGRFGFFAHPALSEANAGEPLGNYGFMDQIAALQWVQRNVRAFGGDPGKVTVFGQSAGGESVNYLMLAADAKNLFHKAIVQSGGGRTPWPKLAQDDPQRPSAQSAGRKFAQKVGAQESAEGLRAIPAAKVLGGLTLINKEEALYSGPMIDGRIVSSSVAEGFAAGRQMRIPYMVGATSGEFQFLPGFVLRRASLKLAEQFGFDQARLIAAYGSEEAFETKFGSDATFVEPARHLAAAAAAGQPTYLYRFAYVTESKRRSVAAAAHATDVPYSFGTLPATGDVLSDADRRAAQIWGDFLVAFAKTGVPAVEGQPAWPPYSVEIDRLYEFGNEGAAVAPAAAPGLDAIAEHYGVRVSRR